MTEPRLSDQYRWVTCPSCGFEHNTGPRCVPHSCEEVARHRCGKLCKDFGCSIAIFQKKTQVGRKGRP